MARRMSGGKVAYVDKIPNCDFCKLKHAKYDAKTVHGPWANMCPDCFNMHALGKTGLGYGQELRLKGE